MADLQLTTGEDILVRGENGVEFIQTVPAEGTTQRELLEYMLGAGRMELVVAEADEVAPVAPAEAPQAADERPAVSAPKPAWVAYAIASGVDPDEAEAATKADLVDRFGG